MTKNIGAFDGAFRMLLAVVVMFIGILAGSWWGLVGFIFAATAIAMWCPVYDIVGVNTCSRTSTNSH